MTFPSSLTRTFDTSLVDVNRSFSSTETNTSTSSSTKENQQPPSGAACFQATTAGIHDHHDQERGLGKMADDVLDAIDAVQVRLLLRDLVNILQQQPVSDAGSDRAIAMLHVGCRDGRTVEALLDHAWTRPVRFVGCDSDAAKVVAHNQKYERQTPRVAIQARFNVLDLSDPASIPQNHVQAFDVVVSSLGFDSMPLPSLFAVVAKTLRIGGTALVMGMHSGRGSEMEEGRRSLAGELLGSARDAGLAMPGKLEVVAVTKEMLQGVGFVGEIGREGQGVAIWYGLMVRHA